MIIKFLMSDKIRISFPSEGELIRTLHELNDNRLKENIITSMIREGSKEIVTRARTNIQSVKASSGWKTDISKSIGFKKSRKKKSQMGQLAQGSVYPQTKKQQKRHRNTGHLFNSGTKRGIPRNNFMGKALEQGLQPGLERMDKEANKILTRFAKRKGFKIR